MRLRTEIEIMPSSHPIGCRDGIFVLGSCFAENIGGWLKENSLDVCLNPFGVLYNPASIASALNSLLSHKLFSCEEAVQASDGLFYSFAHHGKFSAKTPEELIAILNKNQETAGVRLFEAKHLLVTFGTSWVFEKEGEIVANCHKFPAREFSRRRLSVDEIVDTWRNIIEEIGEEKHFVFTVSPIRHVKDGLHGNQLSKATLLLAIDRLCQLFPKQVEYLPIYELLIDDLRDYRFYADDLVHPSELAIDFVKEYFSRTCLDRECQEFLKEIEPIIKATQHRPLHLDSDVYHQFQENTRARLLALKEKYNLG